MPRWILNPMTLLNDFPCKCPKVVWFYPPRRTDDLHEIDINVVILFVSTLVWEHFWQLLMSNLCTLQAKWNGCSEKIPPYLLYAFFGRKCSDISHPILLFLIWCMPVLTWLTEITHVFNFTILLWNYKIIWNTLSILKKKLLLWISNKKMEGLMTRGFWK